MVDTIVRELLTPQLMRRAVRLPAMVSSVPPALLCAVLFGACVEREGFGEPELEVDGTILVALVTDIAERHAELGRDYGRRSGEVVLTLDFMVANEKRWRAAGTDRHDEAWVAAVLSRDLVVQVCSGPCLAEADEHHLLIGRPAMLDDTFATVMVVEGEDYRTPGTRRCGWGSDQQVQYTLTAVTGGWKVVERVLRSEALRRTRSREWCAGERQ
jgi:hypothetical protein